MSTIYYKRMFLIGAILFMIAFVLSLFASHIGVSEVSKHYFLLFNLFILAMFLFISYLWGVDLRKLNKACRIFFASGFIIYGLIMLIFGIKLLINAF